MESLRDNDPVVCAITQVSQACQIMAGRMIDWVDPPDPAALAGSFLTIASPTMELHIVAIERVLSSFTSELTRMVHHNFYRRFTSTKCECVTVPLQPVRDPAAGLCISESIFRWAQDFQAQFLACHNSSAQRARRIIDASDGKAWAIDDLAREVAHGRRTLERQFRKEVGDSIAEYRNRMRLAAVIRDLRTSAASIDGVALDNGWRSSKGLYDALGELTALTPSAIRRLTSSEIEHLLGELTVSRGVRVHQIPQLA